MKKEVPNGVMAGIVAVVVVVAGFLIWKFALAPPSAPQPNVITKEALQQREKSVADIKADQQRRLEAAAAGKGGSQ